MSTRLLLSLPMSYHRTFGPAADPITRLGWGLGIVSCLVVLIVGVLVLAGIFRKRGAESGADPGTDPRSLAVSRDSGGMAWIYGGVGISTLVLMGCLVWTVETIAAVNHPPGPPAFTVQVNALQWWWSLRYVSTAPALIFTTANEIHIPVGKPVQFELASSDVIHSFWIPQLAGKMDIIPGQTNVMWLQADQPGTYRGQCAAFCGAQHAHMALVIVADTADDFAAWQRDQLLDGMVPASAETIQGQHIFEAHCGSCHSIRGITPAGIVGPDLTHLMARTTLAAGLLANTPENLADWIAHPQANKPGTRMPDTELSPPELAAVTRYLNTLH